MSRWRKIGRREWGETRGLRYWIGGCSFCRSEQHSFLEKLGYLFICSLDNRHHLVKNKPRSLPLNRGGGVHYASSIIRGPLVLLLVYSFLSEQVTPNHPNHLSLSPPSPTPL